jgi:acetyl-CoA carboxylase biotin carboxyl carrier protein
VTLTAKDVAEITRVLEESTFDELKLEIDGLKLSLRRGASREADWAPADLPPAPAAAVTPVRTTPSHDKDAVLAPMLGTFYRSPKPGAPPYVDVGAQVEQDSIVGIIEVMKLMNTIRAGVRGTVAEILAQDGALVEFGEVLLRVTHG